MYSQVHFFEAESRLCVPGASLLNWIVFHETGLNGMESGRAWGGSVYTGYITAPLTQDCSPLRRAVLLCCLNGGGAVWRLRALPSRLLQQENSSTQCHHHSADTATHRVETGLQR